VEDNGAVTERWTPSVTQVELETEGGCLRCRLLGEVDLTNAQALQAQIQAHILEVGPARVVMDLTDVEYIDSQGVRLLLEVVSTVRERHTPLELVAPAGSVAGELLAISHVDDLPVHRLNGR
jgi:anti-sigma B factor antagonist